MALQENVLIKLLSTGGKKVLGELKNISKELTGILKKQEAVNKTALKLNKVRAATRGIKGSGLNLNTSTPLEGLDDNQLEKKLSKLSGTTRRYTVALNKANKELNEYVRSLATSDGAQNKFTGSNRKVTTQVSSLQNRLNGLSRSNKEYTSTLQAVLRGEQALFEQQNKRAVDELAQFPQQRLKKDGTPDQRFTRTGVEDLVGTTIEEFNKGEIANSINGLNNYINRLEALRAKVELGSKSFNDLQQQIALVNLKLKEADPLSFSSKIDPKQKAFTSGPATDLSDNESVFREKLNFAEKLSRVDDKRLQLLSRINDSSLDEVKKQQLKNQLAQTDVNLQQKELELAKANNKEVERELSSLNKKQRQQKFRKQGRDSIISSALIGGGFPFLFGGGPVQAAAGALGGGIGAALTPGGGFAGSIAATAAVSQISQAVAAVAELGQAMNPLTADMSAMAKAAGLANTAEAQRLKLIEQTQGKQAAFNAALEELQFVVGGEGVKSLQEFGNSTRDLANAWSRFTTGVAAKLAGLLKKLGLIDGATNVLNYATKDKTITNKMVAQYGNKDQSARANLALGLEEQITNENKKIANLRSFGRDTKELEKARDILQQTLNTHQSILDLEKVKIDQQLQHKAIQEFVLKDINDENKLLENQLKFGMERGALETEIAKKIKEAKELATDGVVIDEQRIRNGVLYNAQIKKQLELWTQIKDTIATGLTSAIKGLIEGTKTLGESLSAIAKQIADLILQKAILSAVDKVFTFGSGGVTKGSVSDLPKVATAAQGAFFGNGIRPFSTGGITTRPTLGLIGEAGESEYIIPASKMSSAMQRYSAGARGESVIPGTGSSQSVGGGGSSTVVNYSGPILTFNSEEFVPKSAVGEIIATATARGAAVGESRTISSLKNSRGRRASLGL